LNSSQYIDYINMMTYGMVTSGAQYQNALYPSSTYHHATFKAGKTLISCSISESVAIFKDQYNIPLSKIIVGVAFYGIRQTRTFNVLTQQWSAWAFAGSVYYTDIALHYADHPQYTRNYDQTAGVPYIIKTDGTEFISYDNYKSIRDKGIYIISQQLGGMMFWENGTDSTGTLLEGVRAGLNQS
jgi:chitinase